MATICYESSSSAFAGAPVTLGSTGVPRRRVSTRPETSVSAALRPRRGQIENELDSVHDPAPGGDAVDFVTLRRHGAEAKLPRDTIECSTISTPIGRARITCSIDMAVFLIDAEKRGNTESLIACAEGVASTFKAIDEERARPGDESPASHTQPAPN